MKLLSSNLICHNRSLLTLTNYLSFNQTKSSHILKSISSSEQSNNTQIIKQLIRNISHRKRSTSRTITGLPKKFNMEWPRITLFGDSITRRSHDPDEGCWASHIASKTGSFFNVDVRGFEGYNSKWGLELMPRLFPKSYLDKVEIFIPFFGHNDSWETKSPLSVPLAQYEANMRAIIKYVLENGVDKSKIIMITPGWYFDKDFQVFLIETNMPSICKDLDSAKSYRDAIVRIATEEGIDYIDFFEITKDHQPLKELFCDGIHFSRIGAKILFDNVMPVIEKKIESSFKKPLSELWHELPWYQRPEVVASMAANRN